MTQENKPASQDNNQFPAIQPVKPTDTTPYIQPVIGKLGWDTRPEYKGLFGLGTSPNNGVDFHVFLSFDGLKFDDSDIDNIWNNGTGDKVKSEVDSATAEIPAAVSAANSAASAADSAVAASKVNSQAIDNMKSAATQIKADASDAVKQAQSAIASVDSQAKAIEGQISSVQSAVGSDQKANQAAISAVRSNAQAAQNTISDVAKNLDTVSTNLDTYAKAAAEQGHDITDIKKQQGLLQAGIADVKGNVAQLTATANSLDAAIKDNKGNISDLSDKANQLSLGIKNAQSDVASVIATANQLQSTVENQNKQITNAMQTASAASITASDAKSNAAQAAITASNASVTVGNMQNDVVSISATASQAQLTATNAQSQAMKATATASGFSARIAGVETKVDSAASAASDASKKADSAGSQVSQVVKQVTTNTADIEANQKAIAGKVDQASFDKTNQKVSDLSGQVNIVAGQVSAKASQTDIDSLKKTVNSQAGEIQANANGLLLKADKSVTDALNQSYQSQAAQQQFLANEINTKVSAADVERTIDGKGFATKSMVETTTKEQADQLSTTITRLHNGDVDQMTHLQASIDGVQNTVKTKADQSTVTQLANTYQIKLQGTSLAEVKSDTLKWTQGIDNECNNLVDLDVSKIPAGTRLDLEFDYQADSDTSFLPQFDADPWNPFGTEYTVAKKDTTGHYSKIITAGDWSKSTAKHIEIRMNKWTGTFVVRNLTLKSGDSIQSTFNMLNNDINLRVQKGDVIGQINEEAGRTLIQNKKIYLDADSVVFSNKAFIPNAAIVNLDASKLTFYGSNGTYATMGSSVKQFDQDKVKSTINLQYNGGVEVHSSNNLGSILTMHDDTVRLASKTQNSGSGNSQQYSGFWCGPNQALMNAVDGSGKTATLIMSSNATGLNKDYRVDLDDESTSGQSNYGVAIATERFDIYARDHSTVKAKNSQIFFKDNSLTIFNTVDNNTKNYDVGLHIRGWAEMTGWFNCMGVTQTSLLSAKTRIEPLDPKYALQTINQADVETYQFKTDVANGKTKRHASVIIDDVHDVAQYNTPEEFISENRKGRDDGDIIGYLMGAVQELSKQVNQLKKEVIANE